MRRYPLAGPATSAVMPKCAKPKLASQSPPSAARRQCTPDTRPAPASDGTRHDPCGRRPAPPACPAPAAGRCRTATACSRRHCPGHRANGRRAQLAHHDGVHHALRHPAQLAEHHRHGQRHHRAQLRLTRLGHISFFGLGFLNLIFAATSDSSSCPTPTSKSPRGRSSSARSTCPRFASSQPGVNPCGTSSPSRSFP
jgi:hypothetical protein